MIVKTKKELFQLLPNIPNPTIVTGSEPGDYCNTWFIVSSSTDFKAPKAELPGCKIVYPSTRTNESYFSCGIRCLYGIGIKLNVGHFGRF